jgi:hypothetical protein
VSLKLLSSTAEWKKVPSVAANPPPEITPAPCVTGEQNKSCVAEEKLRWQVEIPDLSDKSQTDG